MRSFDTTLRLVNDSSVERDGWWHWSAWLEGPDRDLDMVNAVTYLLHPTFRPQRQTVVDRSTKFALKSSAWGEFLLAADVQLNSGDSVRLERWLELGPSSSDDSTSKKSPSPREPRIYISGSLADSNLVQQLATALEQRGVLVSTHDSFEEGTALQAELKRALQASDAVIPIFSEPVSRWVVAEANEAVALGRDLMPLVVGSANSPTFAKDFARFQIKGIDEVPAALADSIAGRVKDLITPEED